MAATGSDKSLHVLTASQMAAVTALSAGATQDEAAEAAGVHRVTVTRWVNHHPAFIAEMNRRRAELAAQSARKVQQMTDLALEAVAEVLRSGDPEAAFRWLRMVWPSPIDRRPTGPTESADVIEQVRKSMADPFEELIQAGKQRSAADAEELIAARLSGKSTPESA